MYFFRSLFRNEKYRAFKIQRSGFCFCFCFFFLCFFFFLEQRRFDVYLYQLSTIIRPIWAKLSTIRLELGIHFCRSNFESKNLIASVQFILRLVCRRHSNPNFCSNLFQFVKIRTRFFIDANNCSENVKLLPLIICYVGNAGA